MARRYAFLHFAAGIDWKDVNPTLLADANRLGQKLGKVITITSGYRTLAQQTALYAAYRAGRGNIAAPPGHSAHESGLAVDAVIDGKPIARAVNAAMLAKFGLVAPVKGDPVHLQLAGSGAAAPAPGGGTAAGAVPDTSTPTALGGQAQPDLSIPSYMPAGSPPQPSQTVAAVSAPGSAGAGITDAGFDAARAWQQIAQQPLVSPESQMFAQRAAQALGGTP